MPRTMNVRALKQKAIGAIRDALARYENAPGSNSDTSSEYWFKAWVAKMIAVEVNTAWESYVERRLTAALNHQPKHFLSSIRATGVRRIPVGLADYIIRGGRPYFGIRGIAELLNRADDLLSPSKNPFGTLKKDHEYIDMLGAVRNHVVHDSDASWARYKSVLRKIYSLRSAPEPEEFLHAIDNRKASPARRKSRLHGISKKLIEAINKT
jgi:hypothetical protein